MGHHWRPVQTADHRGPVWESRGGDQRGLNIGIHPPPTVGLIIQTVGNQRVAASIWQTDYGDGQAGLVDPAYASTLYHCSVGRFLPRSCA
jgi:hypothetical protein